jgi:threonine/homoserine/homoserine lactone efflux protein
MDLSLYVAFIGAVVALALLPGPNMALIVANSVAWGPRYGLLTLVGTSTALMVQLAVTGLGLTELLRSAGSAFEVLRWVGVGYLLLLGIMQWRAAVTDLTQVQAEPRSPRAIVARAAFVSLTNPKTLLFFAAFFPQFISTDHPAGPQVALLSLTFLVVIVMVDSCFALLAGRARGLLARHGRLRNRISGGLLVGAGLGLAAVRGK